MHILRYSLMVLVLFLFSLPMICISCSKTYQNNQAVIDAEVINEYGGSKYFSLKLKVTRVISAPSNVVLPPEMLVGIRFDKKIPVPKRRCRFILERPNPNQADEWFIVSWE